MPRSLMSVSKIHTQTFLALNGHYQHASSMCFHHKNSWDKIHNCSFWALNEQNGHGVSNCSLAQSFLDRVRIGRIQVRGGLILCDDSRCWEREMSGDKSYNFFVSFPFLLFLLVIVKKLQATFVLLDFTKTCLFFCNFFVF